MNLAQRRQIFGWVLALAAMFFLAVGMYGVMRVVQHFSRTAVPAITPRAEVTMTIPEGFTLTQIGARVEATFPGITPAQWIDETGPQSPLEADDFTIAARKPDSVDLEGYLFPDTYRFFPDASLPDIVNTLFATMKKRVTALDAPTGLAVTYTTHERLTVASILEREVKSPEDMKEVADILYKRLAAGIALQCDSTINYVTGGNDPSVSLDDRYNVDSPYNTYKNPGLPPGPISNPGFDALNAAWHPSSNDFYYFLTDLQGQVHYAKTYEEHVKNKYKYLK